MPRLAHWNQEEYDRAVHQIHQERQLNLSLDFTKGEIPLSGKLVHVCVARRIFRDGDQYYTYQLDESGKLEIKQEYGESLVDVELRAEALPTAMGLDRIILHWFKPNYWCTQLSVHHDVAFWQLRERDQQQGNITYELNFNPQLQPKSSYLSFDNLLGLKFAPKVAVSKREASIEIPHAGLAYITFRMNNYFSKWLKNYSPPLSVGDICKILISMTFEYNFQVIESNRKDPPFIAKQYDGLVDQSDGNPYLSIPSVTPEQSITVIAKKQVRITPDMLSQ